MVIGNHMVTMTMMQEMKLEHLSLIVAVLSESQVTVAMVTIINEIFKRPLCKRN